MPLLVKLHINYALNFGYFSRYIPKKVKKKIRKMNDACIVPFSDFSDILIFHRDGILRLYLGQNAYYMNRKIIVFYNDPPI